MALRQSDAVRGRRVCTCGTERRGGREGGGGGERVTGGQKVRERERAKVFVGIITLHEW